MSDTTMTEMVLCLVEVVSVLAYGEAGALGGCSCRYQACDVPTYRKDNVRVLC
jgi:hypothetical protein